MRIINTETIKVITPEAHASNIIYYEGHRILVWFGGTVEGEFCCLFSKVDDGPRTVIQRPSLPKASLRNSLWNPVLFTIHGFLFIFYKEGSYCDRWQTYLLRCEIEKGELTIKKKTRVPAGFNGAVKNKPWIEGDEIICGSSVETAKMWTSYIEVFSVDENGGLGIKDRSLPIMPEDTIQGLLQPAVWKHGDEWHALMRSSRDSDRLYHASTNNLMRWPQATVTGIRNPNSSADVLYKDGYIYLACNPSAHYRDPLSIQKWDADMLDMRGEVELNLTADDMITKTRTKELSYPSITERPDGDIDVSYTFCRKNIRVSTIEI